MYTASFTGEEEIATWQGEASLRRIETGRLIISGQTEYLSQAMPSTSFTNGVISVDTQWLSGVNDNVYGILFRSSPNVNGDDCYGFGITATGEYLIAKWVDGKVVLLKDWTLSSAIVNGGHNLLSVAQADDHFEFYVNGVLVEALVEASYPVGMIGVMVSGPQEVAFDDLSIAVAATALPLPLTKAAPAGLRSSRLGLPMHRVPR